METGVTLFSEDNFQRGSPSTYLFIVYDIQRSVHDLLPDVCVKIQYIPGHKNIGNEMTNRAAKDAHGNMELERV